MAQERGEGCATSHGIPTDQLWNWSLIMINAETEQLAVTIWGLMVLKLSNGDCTVSVARSSGSKIKLQIQYCP